MAEVTTSRLARILAGTSGPSSAPARPSATSTTSSTVSGSPLTITVRMADSLPPPRVGDVADLGWRDGPPPLPSPLVAHAADRRTPAPVAARPPTPDCGKLVAAGRRGELAGRRGSATVLIARQPVSGRRVMARSGGPVCGRGSAGRASPCQGEGRGFESRRPLGGAGRRLKLFAALLLAALMFCSTARQSARLCRHLGAPASRQAAGGGMAEWLRQGPAKPCTRVRFPLPPRGRLAQRESASLTRKRPLVQSQYRPHRFYQLRHGLAASALSLLSARRGAGEPNGEPVHHADFVSARSVKMVFMVSAPFVITGLRWCRSTVSVT